MIDKVITHGIIVHIVFFPSIHYYNYPGEPISVKLLVDAVRNVSDWHSLGLHLDLTMSKLMQIQRIHHAHGEERIKAEMFDVWLNSCPDASWHQLVTALKAIGERRVAKEIESRYSLHLPGN